MGEVLIFEKLIYLYMIKEHINICTKPLEITHGKLPL